MFSLFFVKIKIIFRNRVLTRKGLSGVASMVVPQNNTQENIQPYNYRGNMWHFGIGTQQNVLHSCRLSSLSNLEIVAIFLGKKTPWAGKVWTNGNI